MSTWLAHAAVGVASARAVRASKPLTAAAAVCACLPDVDTAFAVFGVPPDSPWTHRGLLHSLPLALLIGGAVALLFRTRAAALLLIAVTASHGLLDTLTYGGPPVTLLPGVHVLSPLRPLPVLPLGFDELFSRWGAAVLGLELLFVVLPALLLVRLSKQRAAVLGVAWLAVAFVATPSFTRPRLPATELDLIPGGAETRLDALRPLLERELTPQTAPWGSSFFPAWLGSEAGRWQDPLPVLLWRTLAGTAPSGGPHASPAEKYDLANGDRSFTAARASLARTHNARPRPRFWFGLCNGVAAASLFHPEPAHDVTLNGITFHPDDVKALLGAAYYQVDSGALLGEVCTQVALDNARICSMSPATLVLATLNALGRQRRSFLVDVYPSPQAQYYAVASARVHVTRETPQELEVELHFTMASTVMGLEESNRAAGTQPVHFTWRAVLELEEGRITAGRWLDDGPDFIAFIEGGPMLHGDSIELNPALHWSFIKDLAEKSAAP
jgi:inner membrane protein